VLETIIGLVQTCFKFVGKYDEPIRTNQLIKNSRMFAIMCVVPPTYQLMLLYHYSDSGDLSFLHK
jgi:hypothetical protein